jgi:phage/plasmid-associated DNA primase
MGDANTGKGTIIEIITKMFPAGSVGAITATQEKSFGLEGLFKKRVVMIPDLPKDFSKLISQSDFQSIISGEGVSIARKNKTAISNNIWTTPLIAADNHLFEG